MKAINKKQSGFTLIELIMVIVILGILSAFALPKFADLGEDARKASISGAIGAMRSAVAIGHSAWLAGGSTATAISLEGVFIGFNGSGYPLSQGLGAATGASAAAAGDLSLAAGISSGDYTVTPGGTTLTLALTGLTCTVTYTAATGAIASSGAGCP